MIYSIIKFVEPNISEQSSDLDKSENTLWKTLGVGGGRPACRRYCRKLQNLKLIQSLTCKLI